MAESDLANPILNSPFEPPQRHFELGERGPTGVVKDGRRPSESFIPVPKPRKGSKEQQQLDFDATGERVEQNTLINAAPLWPWDQHVDHWASANDAPRRTRHRIRKHLQSSLVATRGRLGRAVVVLRVRRAAHNQH